VSATEGWQEGEGKRGEREEERAWGGGEGGEGMGQNAVGGWVGLGGLFVCCTPSGGGGGAGGRDVF
jgi:hypothetical protein